MGRIRREKSIGYSGKVSLLSEYGDTALRILQKNMGAGKNESILIVTDRLLLNLAGEFFSAAQKITKKARLITIGIPKAHGAEPHPDIARMMARHDVSLLITTRSLSHTTARKSASRKGARIASMPGLTRGMFKTALSENPLKIKSINERLIKRLKHKKTVHITAKSGTDITFSLKRRSWLSDHGIYTKRESFGNLPAGEVFIAPNEGKTNGVYVIDASVGGLGKVDKPITITVKDGHAVSIAGGRIARRYSSLIKNRKYSSIAEMGIGTNGRAKITGDVLEDEKVKGTCHIALGNNIHFGGEVDVPFHVDGVIRNPTIEADGSLIMKDGKLCL